MRLRLLLLTSLASVAALVACEDDTGTGNAGVFDPDSGTYVPADASQPQDANVPDVTPDASTDAEPPVSTDVTVHVANGQGPAANITVVFHDEAGAVIGTSKTDATGTVKSTGATPAQVTALLGGGSARNLFTWTHVAAGDELFVNDVESHNQEVPPLDITLPGPYQNASLYLAQFGGCENSSPYENSLAIYLYGNCVNAKGSVLATALSDDVPLAFAFQKGVDTSADAGSFTATVGAWAAASNFTIAALNPPGDTYVDGWLAQVEGSSFFPSERQEILSPAQSFYFSSTFAEGLQPAVFARSASSHLMLTERVATSATNISFDFATALPAISEADVDATDAVHPNLTWTSDAPLTATDGGLVTVSYYDERDIGLTWSFAVAPSATSVKAPSLPTEAAEWAPHDSDGGSGATTFSSPEVLFVESTAMPDEKAFRRDVGRLFPNDYAGDYQRAARAVLPAGTKLRSTAFVPPS